MKMNQIRIIFYYISSPVSIRGKHTHTPVTNRSSIKNSPTTLRLVCCCVVSAVMLLRAMHVYCPLWLVEKTCKFSVPLFAWLVVSGRPLNCHDKRAGGRETDVQVSWTVCPTMVSPPPTHSEEVLVTWGVSGPSEADTKLYKNVLLLLGLCLLTPSAAFDTTDHTILY